MGLVTERMEAWGGFFATQGALAPAGAGTREALGRAAWAHEAASPGLPMVLRDAAASVDPGGTAQPTVMRGASEAQLILAQDGGAERPSETPSAGTAAAEPPGLLERARDVVVDIFTGERRLTPEGRVLIESAEVLRWMVPGQVAWDEARSAYANDGLAEAGAHTAAMLAEVGLTVATAGTGKAAIEVSRRATPALDDAARALVRAEASQRSATQELIGELVEAGVRVTPENVVGARRLADGGIAWLESGSSRAGLQHIIARHGEEFAARGIPEDRIADAVLDAVETGRVVGVQGRPPGRPIYEFTFDGQMQRMAVTIGDNGFIVGANPK